jgi:hypothetical protein
MSEMTDIRERIAQRTQEKRNAWLRQIRRRYSVWMFISGAFSVLVMHSCEVSTIWISRRFSVHVGE